ncbi:Ig-like domain-containing protein, partial [Serratia fonticola]|uniref:Ig-like domain-containing protein n=1 Tax=Serratia fonticola TaxID=47917 RepID=UPI0034C60C88
DENGIASLPVTSDKAGSVKVEADVGGVTSSTELSFVADGSTAKIDENGLTGKPGSTVANGSDVNLVQLPVKDANGNPVPGFDVTFTVTEPDGSTRQQTVTTDENGIASLPVTSDKAGSVKVEADVGGVTSSTELSFVADNSTAKIDENGLSGKPGSTVANGSDVNTVQLPVKDAKGNPVPGFDVTFTVTEPDGSTRQQTVTTDENGIATLPVTSDKAGSVKVEADVGGVTSSTELSFEADISTVMINTTNGLVLETAGKTIETQKSEDTPSELSTHNLIVTMTDKNGNIIKGKAGALDVTFTTTGSARFIGDSTVTIDENGQAKIGVINTAQETVTVNAQLNGQSSNSVPVSFKTVVKSVALSKQDIKLTKYFGTNVTAEAVYSDGSKVDITKTGSWKSSNAKISVDSVGYVTSVDETETGKLSITFEGVTAETDVNVIVAKTSAVIGTKTAYASLLPKEKYPTLTLKSASVIDGFYSNGKLIAGGPGGQASAEVLDLDKVTSITGYSARVAITGLPDQLLEMLTWKDGADHKVGSSTGTAYTATVSDTIYGVIVYAIGTNGQSGVFVSGLQIIYN